MRLRPRVLLPVLAVTALAAVAVLARTQLAYWMVVAHTPKYAPRPGPRTAASTAPRGLRWLEVAHGLTRMTDLGFVPGTSGQAIVLEQTGAARTLDLSHARDASPPSVAPGAVVLDLEVRSDSELGLLGIAFHPGYPKNGLVYTNSTPLAGEMRTRISEWRLPADVLGRKPATGERVLLEVAQPYPNHNGGQLVFGPDGFLYVGLGDGGWRGDPHGHGQNLGVLLGKMLRIDVDGRSAGAYGIPADNPFVGRKGARPEIWAYGLRNPWRYSFDPHGQLVVADVGQDRFEEIDLVKRGDNLGWNVREGRHCFEPKENCPTAGLVEPIFEYGREAGTSVTGGYVYTGSLVPELAGQYVFGDFTSGRVWALKLPGPYLAAERAEARELGVWPFLISSFARDEQGEIYLLDYAGGKVYRMAGGG